MTDGSVDPTPASGVAPRARIAGVDTTAPPTPNMPDSTPVPTPASSVRIVRHGSDISLLDRRRKLRLCGDGRQSRRRRAEATPRRFEVRIRILIRGVACGDGDGREPPRRLRT